HHQRRLPGLCPGQAEESQQDEYDLGDLKLRFGKLKEFDRMYSKAALMAIVREKALQLGEFKLASGKMSKFYLDCRKVTLDSAGANQIADGMLEVLQKDWPDAVGGMAIGADPISAAIIT